MKTISKRLSAVLLSVYMVFGVVSTDYLTVQAFEWVVPSLTVGDSILWLMGLLGMTYTEGASAWRDVSPEYEQDFIDYANEHGLTYTETSTWLNDTASGKLNQLSDVWTNFKEWVKSKFASSTAFDGTISSACSSVIGTSVTSQYNNFDIVSGYYFYNTDRTILNFKFFNSKMTLQSNNFIVGTPSLTITCSYNFDSDTFTEYSATYNTTYQNNTSYTYTKIIIKLYKFFFFVIIF